MPRCRGPAAAGYGSMPAYQSTLIGQRGGAFQNLQVEEVEAAQRDEAAGIYLITVSMLTLTCLINSGCSDEGASFSYCLLIFDL